MAQQIFSYILHGEGVADDATLEMVSAAKKIDPDASLIAVITGSGAKLDAVCNKLTSSFQEVWKIDHEELAHPNAEIIRKILLPLFPQGSIILMPHEHFGMDLAPGLSVKLDAAFLADMVDIEGADSGLLRAVRQEYNGQVSTHVACDLSGGAVITVRPGSFQADESQDASGEVIDKTADALKAIPDIQRRFLEMVEAEAGDVDITKSEVLISVGRGIEDQDNLDIVHELAAAVGGDVSCSRPVVDAHWLEKARQVGTSGQTVKPKVYMALGISGAFQHLAGLKGNPFIVAINKNPKAPIFQTADIGVVGDILDYIPALTEKINEIKG
jgi:electron transfer flavoprotein alpha subunit